MKILVCIKRVIDYSVKIRVKSDHSGVETANVKHSINPFDEIALEEAIRLREKGIATEVVLVTCGQRICQETLRQGLAIGADRAILLETDQVLEPLSVAKCLQFIIQKENPALVIMGKQAIDDDCNQTGQLLAALLDWPQATFASAVQVHGEIVTVTREIDSGLETLAVTLPAIITTDLRLNQPRFPSMPNIMKSKSKPLEALMISDLNIDIKPHISILDISLPSKRKSGIKINNINELISKLKEELRVI